MAEYLKHKTASPRFIPLFIFALIPSDSIDIMQVYSDVTNIKEKIPENYYSEIYIVYAPDELVQNLKTQFGEQIDSLEIEGISPMWKINLNENKFLE